jgi:putative acetyltransferase
MRAGDYPEVLSLWRRSEGMGLGLSDGPREFRSYLRRNPRLSQVAVAGKRIVAAVLCGHDGRRGMLHHLAVDRAWRRRGLGRGLVGRCMEALAKEGIPKCNLLVFSANRRGLDFWRKTGWDVRGDLRLVQRATEPGSDCCSRSC